ncbi:MAG: Nitrate/nitrite response regulator protein [uncultured Rubrobacteraceae bacterium]|uniref:Nitrate/nitrite response regulator protein n=1 Tax=uncultured Rubrobacteraceae bacterium TaxID=349277 RepID=A0A6J4RUF8_9ACTN|nr:MAG: Nitrate/nitrite response regulator protein [uncultured Rubrobacteraceae bacterium]
MEDRAIKILLVDDHTMFRQGLKEMLSTDAEMRVVGEADNGSAAVDLAAGEGPDVVILDVEMPGISAAETLEALLALSPAPRVLVVSMYDSPRLVRDLLGRGASGYLVKSASLEDLLTAVRRAASSPEGSGRENVILAVPRSVLEKVEGADEERLSGREQQILLLAARGLSNRRISQDLHISEATVKRHLANVYEKMGVGSRGEASQKALSEGWITAGDLTRNGDG